MQSPLRESRGIDTKDAFRILFLSALNPPTPFEQSKGATKRQASFGQVGGRMWESNPPGPFIRSRAGFEVQRGHQTPCPPVLISTRGHRPCGGSPVSYPNIRERRKRISEIPEGHS